MIEVSMTLYTPEEATMFAQFTEIMYDKRVRESVARMQPAPDRVEQELTKEAESLVPPAVEVKPPVVVEPKVAAGNVGAAIDAFKTYAQEKGLPAARAVLDKLGLKRAGDITAEQVPALLEAIK